MNFDDLLRDPTTVHHPSSSPSTSFWPDISFIPQSIQYSISVNFSFSFLTQIQNQIFSALNADSKIYNIVSPPNTGKTLALCILSLSIVKEHGKSSVLWLVPSIVNTEFIKSQLLKLDSSLIISTENILDNADIYLVSLTTSTTKKFEFIINEQRKSLKMLIVHCANDILFSKQKRLSIGQILLTLYKDHPSTYPRLYFTQLGNNSTHVSTFINELNLHTETSSHISLSPLTIECSNFDTLKQVPQYYIQVSSSSKTLSKILSNSILRVKKGLLIFGQIDKSEIPYSRYEEISSASTEPETFMTLLKLKTREVKVVLCKINLQKYIKTYSVGAVVHIGVPSESNEPDYQEYRSRVERVYSSDFIGFSVIICSNDDSEKVKKLKESLGVNIESFPYYSC